ncbi:MAG: 4Fe-4S dicluster domain-containing protein [Elusimicrobiota bacterium]|nr:4Fe-4S dicluster domain-containing protein [Elusimicrobiota bacterium]MDH5661761.1 4Fe-4S dicluster domain-containing protein [Elusimicrobiota bacterium]
MRINLEKCIGCMECISYCPARAITARGAKCTVDENRCFECYVCLTSGICPVDAFEKISLKWPRILRHIFSSVAMIHKGTGIDGRGTAEMKTNDVTGRYRHGEVGFTVDVGRPGIGTTFEDIKKISMAVAKVGVKFEKMNPLTKLMRDKTTGRLRDDIKGERVLSCVLEFKTEDNKAISVINALKDVSKLVNTVFSVGCICRCRPDGTIPVKNMLDEAGIFYRPNGKTNIGLGRPLAP